RYIPDQPAVYVTPSAALPAWAVFAARSIVLPHDQLLQPASSCSAKIGLAALAGAAGSAAGAVGAAAPGAIGVNGGSADCPDPVVSSPGAAQRSIALWACISTVSLVVQPISSWLSAASDRLGSWLRRTSGTTIAAISASTSARIVSLY